MSSLCPQQSACVLIAHSRRVTAVVRKSILGPRLQSKEYHVLRSAAAQRSGIGGELNVGLPIDRTIAGRVVLNLRRWHHSGILLHVLRVWYSLGFPARRDAVRMAAPLSHGSEEVSAWAAALAHHIVSNVQVM